MKAFSPVKTAGQSLIEVVVAVGVVVILATGLIVATTSALKSSQFARTKSLAIRYAQEGMELTRRLRNSGWAVFSTRSGLWCLDKAGNWTQAAPSCAVNVDNLFTRGVTFNWNSLSERMEVTVNVAWSDAGSTHDTQLVTYFTQWK
ncbi:MAG: hypothetical protein ACOY0S_02810 [Patescibacteria group bacterium]